MDGTTSGFWYDELEVWVGCFNCSSLMDSPGLLHTVSEGAIVYVIQSGDVRALLWRATVRQTRYEAVVRSVDRVLRQYQEPFYARITAAYQIPRAVIAGRTLKAHNAMVSDTSSAAAIEAC